ncbi:hypothetical protein FRC14_001223 [Serendipita sp. 396]|nr:hypothetical protein FRC14_001223 [Serendipita sp. 396]KAG8789763.1 hypothetical protein FRC16_001175 [Serendipita sp. 398]KAG8828614.1 hypothetical protein FRC19_000001 [Serendipita sp. 401]KAG8844409.1 hypothetical protein FRC20_003542 [Serendipita sp. 405]KAG9028236.1 hypothetical protein FS842_004790 [Serendipita sp. 407]
MSNFSTLFPVLLVSLLSFVTSVDAKGRTSRGGSSLAKGALIAIVVVVVVAVIICAIVIFCCLRLARRKKGSGKASKDGVLPMTNNPAPVEQPNYIQHQPTPGGPHLGEYQANEYQQQPGYNTHQTEYNAVSSYGGQPPHGQQAGGFAPPPGPPNFPAPPSGY